MDSTEEARNHVMGSSLPKRRDATQRQRLPLLGSGAKSKRKSNGKKRWAFVRPRIGAQYASWERFAEHLGVDVATAKAHFYADLATNGYDYPSITTPTQVETSDNCGNERGSRPSLHDPDPMLADQQENIASLDDRPWIDTRANRNESECEMEEARVSGFSYAQSTSNSGPDGSQPYGPVGNHGMMPPGALAHASSCHVTLP